MTDNDVLKDLNAMPVNIRAREFLERSGKEGLR